MPGDIISILLDDNQDSSNGHGVAENDNGLMRASNAMRFTLTLNEMQQIFPAAPIDRLREITDVLNEYMPRFGLTNMNFVAEFLGQVYIETNGLTIIEKNGLKTDGLEEDLYYTDANKLKNNFSIFDSYKDKKSGKSIPSPYKAKDYLRNSAKLGSLVYDNYWGRGLLHVSTKYNYAAFSKYMKDHFGWNIHFNDEQNRDLLKTNYIVAVLSGLWYFKTHVMDKLNMQTATVTDITRKINPHLFKNKARIDETNEALKVLKAGASNSFPKSRLHNNTLPRNFHATPQDTPKHLNPIHIKTTGFNTTPPSIGNSNARSITQPVIQNLTINNTTNSTMSPADIQKQIAEIIIGAASDANIKSGIA